jgi:hypothetical protein
MLVTKDLKVGQFVLCFRPARLHEMDTVHSSEAKAIAYMKKLAKEQLHWNAQILEVKYITGCRCHE